MDRRVVWAILLMMVIAVAPALFTKPKATRGAGPGARDTAVQPAGPAPRADTLPRRPLAPPPAPDTARGREAAPGDTVIVSSPLYTYGIGTRGGRLVTAFLRQYRSQAPGRAGEPVQLLPPDSELLDLMLVQGQDTVRFGEWNFTPSATALSVERPAALRLNAERDGLGIELRYGFTPDEYRIDLSGRISGIGPNGGMLLIGMGPRLARTEADSADDARHVAFVTKRATAERTSLADLEPGVPRTFTGPFDWAALKSKYFVTAVLAFDSTGGGISGATVTAPAAAGKDPAVARVRLTLPVGPAGAFGLSLYAGPMEYDRLRRIGHDFDDVNPYGWPGFRTLIRFFAVPTRWLLVWMHESLGLAYGIVLVVFGILVRIVLWPLNQKAMRASMQMQAVQPLMKELQERHKDDPQRLQQEMFRLYKEHNVNPFGGCWPMLLPMPVLFALFFVLQNSIELRGTSFLWLPDLSRPDPVYIIPLIMGLSMYALSKVGQMGMEPNPQMKMMLYMMPVMMTVLFLNFPSGLNLYYAVSNIASVPQQWLLAQERMKRVPPPAPPKPAAPAPAPKRRKG
ncbi:MAG TPA: membrane protein insertase YidC [Gemmatimonadales bacterium]|nr:membrane protein insertase YidC [Gemmatimonadales bacterium]